MTKTFLTNSDIAQRAQEVARKIRAEVGHNCRIYGIPRGGIPAMFCVKGFLPYATIVNRPEDANVFIDDLIDSGATWTRYLKTYGVKEMKYFYALFDKTKGDDVLGWIVFPWENGEEDQSATDIPTRFLQYIGEDVKRDGLKDTPKRIIKAWDEMYAGYKMDPATILGRVFDNDKNYDEMVILKDIEFYSMCEHHALPFFGKAHIAYIPVHEVVGISKLARLVDCFAKRLQIQERLTQQIVQTIEEVLKPLGCACVIEAQHLCMKSRGVEKQNSVMVTSALSGVFKKAETRAEFMNMIGRR